MHSFTSSSHVAPVHALGHVHWNPWNELKHVPPFLHGLLVQLSNINRIWSSFIRISRRRSRTFTLAGWVPLSEACTTRSSRVKRLKILRLFGVFIAFTRCSNVFRRRSVRGDDPPFGRWLTKLMMLTSLIRRHPLPCNRNEMFRFTADSMMKFPSSVKNFGLWNKNKTA